MRERLQVGAVVIPGSTTPIQFEASAGLSDVAHAVDEDPVDEIDEEEAAQEEDGEEEGAQ